MLKNTVDVNVACLYLVIVLQGCFCDALSTPLCSNKLVFFSTKVLFFTTWVLGFCLMFALIEGAGQQNSSQQNSSSRLLTIATPSWQR